MTIFDELRADHDHQRDLMAKLLETDGDSVERRTIYTALSEALDAHAAAEEKHFYTVLMTADMTQEKARHSVSEHKDLDDLIEKLDELDRSTPEWLDTLRTLDERLEHHLEEEEREVFQLAGRVMSDDAKEQSALGYRQMMDDHVGAASA